MTVLLGRILNGACWGVIVIRTAGPPSTSSAVQSAILAATL